VAQEYLELKWLKKQQQNLMSGGVSLEIVAGEGGQIIRSSETSMSEAKQAFIFTFVLSV
jgi:hypothetical protein